jgi:hypothetical protein
MLTLQFVGAYGLGVSIDPCRLSGNSGRRVNTLLLVGRPDDEVSVLYDLAPNRGGPPHAGHRHAGASEAASLSWQTVLQLRVWLGNWVGLGIE